jgi:hypothetical protein
MRHIKLFEEYSDDELKDLIGDLETIGHKPQLYRGKDFGFGQNLRGENDGYRLLYFTPEGMAFLIENGVVDKDLTINKDYMGIIKGQYYNKKISGEFKPVKGEINGGPGYYIMISQNQQGLQRWPEAYSKHFRFRKETIIRLINEFLSKIEKIRK